jgi:hypothetical protein
MSPQHTDSSLREFENIVQGMAVLKPAIEFYSMHRHQPPNPGQAESPAK